jgi:hypothetical protein
MGFLLIKKGNNFRYKSFFYIFNSKAIGLFLNDRVDLALEQIEAILDLASSDSISYEGKVFLLNVSS